MYDSRAKNGQPRPKKYSELTKAQQLQDDCDVQATNIILHSLPPDVYALVNHQEAAKDIWDKVKMLMKGTKLSYQEHECKLYNLFDKFAHVPGNKGIATTSKGNVAVGPPRLVKCYNYQREGHMTKAQEAGQIMDEKQLAFLANLDISEAPITYQKIPQNLAFQANDLDAYDSDCDDLFSAKAVLMANLSSCDLEYSKQTHVDDFKDNEIHSGSNIILYSQYLHETQDVVIQDTNPSAPNDLLVLSLVEQITDHVAHLDKENQTNKTNAKHTAFQQEIDTLKETLSNNVKEKESLSNTLTILKTESKYIDKEIVLENNVKNWRILFVRCIDLPQWIQPTLYNGSVIAKEHVVIYVIDDEETLILEENKLWLKHSSLSETPVTSHTPVIIEAPRELPKSCVNDCSKCLELEIELSKKKDFIEKEAYDKLVKRCYINELKAQSQAKDAVIRKLKEKNKSLSEKDRLENVKKNIDEIETINIELEHSVAKLLSKNEILRKEREHLKLIYKDQFDLIGKTRVQSKEHCDSLIAQINVKFVENSDLNAQLQEKVFTITALKNELRKIKGKNVVNTVVSKPNATLAPGMFKLDIEPISARLKNNKDAHEVYIDKTIEYDATLHRFVERARTQYPSESLLELGYMFTKHVQELLVYASQTCPNSPTPSEKLVDVTPSNKEKRVRFAEPVTSSNNIPKHTNSLKTKDSNKPLLTFTGVKPTTSASGLKPSGNTKNNRISRPPRSNQKNKVEDHPRTVKSSLNKMNSISEPISNALVKHSVRNAKFESMCAICNKCLFDANYDMCLVDFVNDVNVRSKSKSKRNKKKKAWKPTGKVFTNVGYKWKPTGRFFTIVGTSFPLTRITPKKIVHLKETTSKSVETPKPDIKVYGKRPKQLKSVGSSKKAKIVESKIANNSEPIHLWGSNATDVPSSSSLVNDSKFLGTVRFGNDQVAKIMGKKYILVIIDDYSRFTWVKFMRSKDEAPGVIINSIKNIQVCLNATIRNVRTDNGTEFVNQTLCDFYENVSISHETSVARTPQQNDFVKRRN
ncbi:retrovirus-related pol polyprotein from transposon TNT 1-94 [Tanacetum coccineum]|uniref:Retrovirus-related pol polyprotein from transposon TNT 1-94 n=1 Tax=Tanacetum coccineum TaxID=301880 RepID=A0ABQ5F5G5_9ASTR